MNEAMSVLWSHARRAPLAFLLAASAAVAAPNVPPPAQEAPILITGATLHTVSGAPIVGGRMLFSDGRIVAIGGAELNVEMPERVVDLSGLHVYPGLIDANTALGLVEIEAVRATIDIAEPGPVNPNVRAERAVNPDSELLPVARANGVLVALSVPNRGENGLIVGTSAALQLDGWTWEDMTVRAPVGMHVFWPAMRVPDDVPDVRRTELIERRAERIETLETSLEQAAAYRRARARPTRALPSIYAGRRCCPCSRASCRSSRTSRISCRSATRSASPSASA